MSLQDRLGKKNRSLLVTYYMTPFIGYSQKDKTVVMENRTEVTLGQGGERVASTKRKQDRIFRVDRAVLCPDWGGTCYIILHAYENS